MNVTAKPFLDVSTLTTDNVPWSGDMPDVSIAYPWTADIFPNAQQPNGNPDQPNGAVWPWRIFLGAEDDPNRAKVYKWEQVDDLGGIADLWAGVYNGTIYLAAGDEPAAAADDNSDATGVPISDAPSEASAWHNGQPVLPFTPLAQNAREELLKNKDGQWRRLVWEPIAIFDIAPSKKVVQDDGTLNVARYTLWMVVERPFIAFYTTSAPIQGETQQDGAPARWPFSYYAARNRIGQPATYQPGDKDGGMTEGFYSDLSNGYRLAPMPWQNGDGELESVEAFTPYDGAHEGQFYALPPAWPCPRLLTTMFDTRIDADLINAYQGEGEHWEYKPITKERARQAIIGTTLATATHHRSIDPALFEELGREFADGTAAWSEWQTDPPPYFVVFSLHLDAASDRWPHWLAVMACHAPTALLTASACAWYNDFSTTGGTDGDPDDATPPKEDEETITSDDQDGLPVDDDETTSDQTTEPWPMFPGTYFEAGDGVTITRKWLPNLPGWSFAIHLDDVPASGTATCNTTLTVSTTNDPGTYDWPEGNQYGLSMFYGVTASGSTISVSWQSSYQGSDRQPKTATASVAVPCDFVANVEFYDLQVDSDTAPDFGGNVTSALKMRTFTKRGTMKTWSKSKSRWIISRFSRKFDVYKISAQTTNIARYAAAYAANNAPARTGTFTPATVQGRSDDLTGPTVTAESANATATQNATLPPFFGDWNATLLVDYDSCTADYTVTGSARWNTGNKSGSISGTFTVTIPQTSKEFEI